MVFALAATTLLLALDVGKASVCDQAPHPAECTALTQFGAALDYPKWQANRQFTGGKWGSSPDVCTWEGVQCEGGHVTLLGMIGLGVTGDVDNVKLLVPLTKLKELVLSTFVVSSRPPRSADPLSCISDEQSGWHHSG
jgi:hypothetical protein